MDSYELVENTCNKVLNKVATVSRAQVEISENIARKGWSGGGLDDLLYDADDPFSKKTKGPYGTADGDAETADGEECMDNEDTSGGDVVLNELLEGTSRPSTSKTFSPKSKSSSTASTPHHSYSNTNVEEVRSNNNENGENGHEDSDEDVDNLMGAENSFSLPPTRNSDEETADTLRQLSIKKDNDGNGSDSDAVEDQSSNI